MTTPTADAVATLLDSPARFEPESIVTLEAFVDVQLADADAYSLDANLALLKLYQFSPDRLDTACVARVLTLALMRLPASDFALCQYLVPERVHSNEHVGALLALAHAAEQCQFAAFWPRAAKSEVVQSAKGFDAALRRFVISVLSITYQTIEESFLLSALNLSSSEALKPLADEHKWTMKKDGDKSLVSFPLTEDNQARPKQIAETIKFEQLGKILRAR